MDNSIGIHHTRNQTFIHFGQHPEEIVESIKLSMYDFPVSTADRIRNQIFPSQSEHVCGANTIRKNRKKSELASLSISMKKKEGKIDVAICLKEVTGFLIPILQQTSDFVSYAKCSWFFFPSGFFYNPLAVFIGITQVFIV